MQIDHQYMVQQLRPYALLAGEMDDKFVGYLLGMVIEHCHNVAHPKPVVPMLARWDYPGGARPLRR